MELVEREAALGQLASWIDDARAGRGRLVLVAGEAGAGKSSLVRACAAAASGLDVRFGGCDPLTTPRPLGAIADMLRGADGPPSIGTLLDVLTGPAMLVFEDLHWADEATLDAIRHLARRIIDLPVLALVTYRDDEVGTEHPLRIALGDLVGSPALRRLRVPNLSVNAVARLTGASGRTDAVSIHRITGGNAFFVSELIATADEAVPATVRDAVMARVGRLGVAAREMVEYVSASPQLVEFSLLTDLAAVDEAIHAGVLVEEAGGVRFRHELARLAVHGAVPPGRRIAMHRRYVQQLLAGGDASRIVHHADAAGDGEVVLVNARLAAEHAAAVGAHREAAAHWATLLRYAQGLPARTRGEIYANRSYECYLTNQVDEALAARQDALACAGDDPIRVGDALRWLSRLHWFMAHFDEAHSAGRRAVETLETAPPGRELAMAYSNMSQLAMLADDVSDAESWGERAIALARQIGEDEVVAHALNNVGSARGLAGRVLIEKSLELALTNGWHEHAARAYTNLAALSVIWRESENARRYGEAGIAYCIRHDLDSWRLYIMGSMAQLALSVDDWNAAQAAAVDVLRHERSAPVTKINALAVLTRLRARRGDPDPGGVLADAEAYAGGSAERQRLLPVALARAETLWHAGVTVVPAQLRSALALYPPSHPLHSELAFWLGLLGEPGESEWRPTSSYERAVASVTGGDVRELTTAAETLLALGATPALRRVQHRLRELGAPALRGPRTSTRSDPNGLTARESEVATLLIDGRTNAEIADQLVLSAKTVEHHVSAVLRKLGVTTRREAARKLGGRAAQHG